MFIGYGLMEKAQRFLGGEIVDIYQFILRTDSIIEIWF